MVNDELLIFIEEYRKEYQWLLDNTYIFNRIDLSWENAKIFFSEDKNYYQYKQIVKIMRRYVTHNRRLKQEGG
jgi:hypothetical protein